MQKKELLEKLRLQDREDFGDIINRELEGDNIDYFENFPEYDYREWEDED